MTHDDDASGDQPRLPALYEELERLGAEAAKWADVEASDSTAMVHTGSADPERIREQMVEVRKQAREKGKELQRAADQVKAEIVRELDRQKAEMEVRMRAAMVALAPLKEQVKRMEEGIWTVNLYLGTSEEVTTLRTGEPAPIGTPVTLRTSVLAMDEEVAAFPVEDGEPDWQGMDFRDLGMFDEWVTTNPEHLAQVLPEPKGIVVFTPRRTEKFYAEDPMVNTAMNANNFESYWLIRNGENLYRLKTDFAVGRTLMPITSEFTRLFQTRRYNPETRQDETVDITPGTREWEKAEKAQDAKRRHYMRVALIVQGLIDRTDMFQPLPAAVNVMQQSTYDSGMVVVVNDTERAITTAREPYYDWIRRLNDELRPGMRIIGVFRGAEWDRYDIEPSQWSRASGNTRISPNKAERPPKNTLLLIEGRKDFDQGKGLVVRYQRTEEVYDPNLWVETRPGWGYKGGYRVPEQRASAVILPTDRSIIPFDLVTEAEMQEYLTARTERHAYADSFPLLQAAINAKRAEREAEAPFRDLLIRVLADDNQQTPEEVAPHLDQLVHAFKVGNLWHRPLVSLSQEDEAKALRLIRAEYQRIVGSGATQERDDAAVAAFREHDPDVMFVGRLSSGKYVAFAPQPRIYGEGVVAQNLWVREHTTTKTAASIKTRDWVIPGVRGNKMTGLYADGRWETWDMISTNKNDPTDDEMTALIATAKEQGMALIQAEGGTDPIYLATGHSPQSRSVVVFTLDGAFHVPARARLSMPKAVSTWCAAALEWERKGTEITTRLVTPPHQQSWAFDYASPWSKPVDADRSVSTPWKQMSSHGRHRSMAMIDVDTDALTAAEDTFRAAVSINRIIDDLSGRVRVALLWLNKQQENAQIEAIKVKFLAEYPDETMWEERRPQLTKGIRPAVDLVNEWHFKRHDPTDADGLRRVYDREDAHLRLDRALRALIDAGHIEWAGLTVAGAYALIDESVPDIYDPISHLTLVEPGHQHNLRR